MPRYHIGYNAACAKNVAYLPPAFRWVHPSGAELLTMVNNNYGSEINVALGGGGEASETPETETPPREASEAPPPNATMRSSILHHGVAGGP